MTINIEINNVRGRITNILSIDQLSVLQDICSFEVEGADFKALQFKKRSNGKANWDGRRKLFNIQHQTFPIGLLHLIIMTFNNAGIQTNIINKRSKCNSVKHNFGIENFQVRDYQTNAVISSLVNGNGIIKAATGCFTGDTIIHVNKSSKGSKQTIESLYCSWHGIVRKISKYGTIGNQLIKNKDKVYVRGLQDYNVGLNKVLDIICKGKMQTIKLTFSDGTILKCTPDHPLYNVDSMTWIRADQFLGLNIGKDTIKPTRSLDIINKKMCDTHFRVPKEHPYAVMVKSGRGTYYKIEIHRAIYEAYINGYCTIDEWRNDIGKVNMKYVDTSVYDIHHIDFDHYNNDPHNLQMLIKSEHSKLHNHYKNFGQGVVQGVKCINIEDNGIQIVYDICCEKYHSYTANGLIVHNSGKTTIAARTIDAIGKNSIFVVHTRDLLYQTKGSFERMFPRFKIGQIGDGTIDYGEITVATMQSLSILGNIEYKSYKFDEDSESYAETLITADNAKVKEFREYKNNVEVVMFDEVQRICSQTAYSARFLFEKANHAFGYSASPWRDDGSDLMIEAAFGNRIVDITASELINKGFLVRPIITVKQVMNNVWSGNTYEQIYKSAVVENVFRNMQVSNDAYEQYKLGRATLVLVTQIKHGNILEDMIRHMGAPAVFISGKSGMKKRKQVIDDMRNGKAPIVIASTIADVGLDVPRLQSIVEAGAGKSSVTALQRLGRVMRPFSGKDVCYFITYRDTAPYLSSQIDKKIAIWEQEKEFIINTP